LDGNALGENRAIAEPGFCPPLIVGSVVYTVIADNTKEEIIQE